MKINNDVKAKISYLHKHDIQSLFNKYIKGNLGIDHFSLNIFFKKQSIFLSPTPQMAEELCKKNFVDEDSNYKSEVYKNLCVYPWRSVQRHEADRAINFIKEEKFGMRSGLMIVRNLGQERYAMYSIATHKRDNADFLGQFHFLFHCKANYISQMGDYMYNSLLPVINQYTEKHNVTMPKIDKFKPINLEENFQTEHQREIFAKIEGERGFDWLRAMREINTKNLRLKNNGRISATAMIESVVD